MALNFCSFLKALFALPDNNDSFAFSNPSFGLQSVTVAIAIAALLLIITGFATDILGFLINFPLTRKFIFKKFSKNIKIKKNEKIIFIDEDVPEIDEDNDEKI